MCRRSDALAELTSAAHGLADACAARIGAAGALREVYRSVIDEGVPPAMVETLGKLGFTTGRDLGTGGKNGSSA